MENGFRLIEQNYRYLFDNASDAIWVHDMAGNILLANRACEKMSGYTCDELVGMNVSKFLSNEFLDTAREVRRKLLHGESLEQPYEQRLFRKDGRIRVLKMATSLITLENDIRGFQHIARDVTEEKQLQENMHYYVQQITRVQEEERKRVARELHDDVGSRLLLLLQRLDGITSRPHARMPQPVRDELKGLRAQAVEALDSLRTCAQGLRPRILDDLGLVPALEWMAEELKRKFGIEALVKTSGEPRNPGNEVGLLLFRIVQEALSNVRKYSQAAHVVVKLEFEPRFIRMAVSDNGIGFEMPARAENLAASGKLGVIGMYERARLAGGDLKIETAPGQGMAIIVTIPTPE